MKPLGLYMRHLILEMDKEKITTTKLQLEGSFRVGINQVVRKICQFGSISEVVWLF